MHRVEDKFKKMSHMRWVQVSHIWNCVVSYGQMAEDVNAVLRRSRKDKDVSFGFFYEKKKSRI